MKSFRYLACGVLICVAVQLRGASTEAGAKIYRQLCAECHGPQGEGKAGKHDEPLYGQRSVESLARLIERTMPEDDPGKCVGEDARAVAAYIHGAFYSPQARARINPPKIDPARLTNRQYRESVADLFGSFLPQSPPATNGGLKAEYFQSKGMNKKSKSVLTRVDTRVAFDFGEGSPMEDITADQFSIAWSGSLLAPDTGEYEFRLRTQNGARLYLNSDLREGDRNRRDDSDAKRQTALIDLWVSSGAEVREQSARMFLLGGRSYPLRLDYFKFKDKDASVRFEWKPPHGVWSVLSGQHLSPESSPSVAVMATSFPPDDGSQGYERGTSVSKGWHDATTRAAVEGANEVEARLALLSGVSDDTTNRTEKLKEFASLMAERAFRRPLADELRRAYVDEQFKEGVPLETAVKRSVMLVLKSPRFLYPDLGGTVDDYTVAARLALSLWDSLPDEVLREAASRGELRTAAQVRQQTERMMRDPRAKAKLGEFFDYWLAVEEAEDIVKDKEAFPGFDEAAVADLLTSLRLFVEEVVWSDAADYRQLLQADHLYLNGRLAGFYGARAGEGDQFVRVQFDPAQRAGIFTHPYLLTAFSYHKSTSPIHRGVFLTRNVLGRFLKPPPMAIEFMDDKFDASLTMREKVTELTKSKTCMACHATINPLGFSLEHYDAIGRFRTQDKEKPVDAQSDYTTTEGEVIRLRGPRDLAEHAVTSQEARLAFIRQLFHHAIKQPPAAYGPDTLERLDGLFVRSGHHVRHLLVEMAVTAALHGFSAPAAPPVQPPTSTPASS